MKIHCAVLALAFALAGCANGYEKYYQALPTGEAHFVPVPDEPRLMTADRSPRDTALWMYQDGYALVGVADFAGPAQNTKGAIAQGKKVGAAIIVISQKYQNTVSGSVPLTLPTSTTSYNSGTATITGSGGFATGTYSGTTTTYGTETTNIPYSIDRYEQAAMFFAPLERRGMGIMMSALTPEQRPAHGTNQAILITSVRNGSPAFVADILPGDFILTMDGKPVYDLPSAAPVIASIAGHAAEVTLIRKGQRLSKSVTIPEGTW